jgi:aminopeptidase-like protein
MVSPFFLSKNASSVVSKTIYGLIRRLYPICRSITGNGVRESLNILRELIPINIKEVSTGTPVFDWSIPKEWNIKDAYVKNARGQRVIDFRRSNLHVVGYSVPIKRKIKLKELRKHLHTLPEYPDWIPYRTGYYSENWGFCLSHNQLLKLKEEEYEICVDATLESGHLTYGEYYVKGQTEEEILISTHICHPSLCNDNLSGIAITATVAKHLSQTRNRYSYRFLFIPSTIGSVAWLAKNEARVGNVRHGLVVANVGDSGKCTYKRTRRGDAEIDNAVEYVLRSSGEEFSILDFVPYGYDERQYCSPGFNLPIGCFMRTPHGQYPEYHTSADNLDFVKTQFLADSFVKILSVLFVLENNEVHQNNNPKCEPQLGRRGLYRGYPAGGIQDLAILWVLNLSDGKHTLLDIAERSGIAFDEIKNAADALLETGLLSKITRWVGR